jgi:hypothetical protein
VTEELPSVCFPLRVAEKSAGRFLLVGFADSPFVSRALLCEIAFVASCQKTERFLV